MMGFAYVNIVAVVLSIIANALCKKILIFCLLCIYVQIQMYSSCIFIL